MTSAVRADFITGTLASSFSGPGGALNPGAAAYINAGDGSAPTSYYYPGQVNWTVAAGPNASWVAPVGSAFQTFCIELTQDIYLGNTYTYSLVNLADAPKPGSSQTGGSGGMGQDKANAIGALWAADYGSIANPTGGSTANENAAAFQLAIWKIEYDWGSANESFSSGNFRAAADSSDPNSARAITQAETWLTNLGWDVNGRPNETNLVALSSPNYQDQVMALPTPAPPTFCLAVIAGAVLIIYGRWRHRPATGIIQ